MLAPSVRHMAFVRADGAPFRFIPGQFVQLHFEHAGARVKRSYSVATRADDASHPDGIIEMAVSYVPGGAATTLLQHLEEGGAVDASGPYGRFCLNDHDANRRYLLIATGTGVTPYRAMLPLIATRIAERDIEVVLIYGARNRDELLYGDEFAAFAAEHPRFTFVPCFSRLASAALGAGERLGYVQDQLDGLAPDAAGDIAYLCGNPNMVDACFEKLKAHGLPVPQIRREKYVSPPDPKRLPLAPV